MNDVKHILSNPQILHPMMNNDLWTCFWINFIFQDLDLTNFLIVNLWNVRPDILSCIDSCDVNVSETYNSSLNQNPTKDYKKRRNVAVKICAKRKHCKKFTSKTTRCMFSYFRFYVLKMHFLLCPILIVQILGLA